MIPHQIFSRSRKDQFLHTIPNSSSPFRPRPAFIRQRLLLLSAFASVHRRTFIK